MTTVVTHTHAPRRPFAKYRALAVIAARQAINERVSLVMRLCIYALILFVFSRLWETVLGQGALGNLAARDMVWYLAATEWVLFAVPMIHLDIEAMIRSGDVAYRLPRPMSFLLAALAEGAGQVAVRLLLFGLAGFGLSWLLAGGLPSSPDGLALMIPFGVLSAALCLLMQAAIGVAAVWLGDVSPVYWLWQKLTFIFGGLLLPFEVYPDWLRTVAEWTPFYPMFYGVGRMTFGLDWEIAARTALQLALWGAATAALTVWFYRRALRALNISGG